jgi:uncharacterized protein DUF6992
MWSDTLLLAERAHLMRLLFWGAACVVLGSTLLAVVAARRPQTPLLMHFAVQTAAWGAIDALLAGLAWRGLAERDLAGATHLDRMLWLNCGLDVGYVAVGVALAWTGWVLGRRLGLVGAGMGVVVQGLALLVLDARFISIIGRLNVGG